MARTARYAHYQYAPWPDPALLAAVQTLNDIVLLESVSQHRDGLTVDITDNRYEAGPQVSQGNHSRLLRLTWNFDNRVYALESYDEFYAGPFLAYHPHHQGVQSPGLYEVVNEPDPWIAEILAENNNTDTFPPYGIPVMMSERTRQMNPHLQETGRYFAANAPISDSGHHAVYVWTGLQPPTPAEEAQFVAQIQAQTEEKWQQQKRKPRYRHLILATENLLLEVLCNDLPQWEWVVG